MTFPTNISNSPPTASRTDPNFGTYPLKCPAIDNRLSKASLSIDMTLTAPANDSAITYTKPLHLVRLLDPNATAKTYKTMRLRRWLYLVNSVVAGLEVANKLFGGDVVRGVQGVEGLVVDKLRLEAVKGFLKAIREQLLALG
jgi:hypothetical protein